ncbi:MAG: alpha/beta hydrolase [Woeseiaceae bacterium]|nr:alpha/beta hydrolase [Woeseiaceae bacterium]
MRTPRIALLLCLLFVSGCSPLTLLSAVSSAEHYERSADIAYGPDPRQRLDVYRPLTAQPDAPLVVFFYGGAWRKGDKAEFRFVASSLTRAGYVVVLPDYRRFPEVRFPAFVDDGAAAVAWAAANAGAYGADPTRLYLMGHSAGAHIAALLALDDRYLEAAGLGSGAVAGLIGLSGPYDFLPIEDGYLTELFPEATRPASQPINFVHPGAPPALLIHGGDDDLVEAGNSERLAGRLMAEGVPVTLHNYAGVGHGRVVVALSPPLDFIAATLDDCIDFIDANERRRSGEAETDP